MKYSYFAFSSLTYAYKGRDALDGAGIRSVIIRLTGSETEKGCRYGIKVNDNDVVDAKNALRRHDVPFTGPF